MTPALPQLIIDDPWLEPYAHDIRQRNVRFNQKLEFLKSQSGSLYDFAGGHLQLGVQRDENEKRWIYREWAPEAHQLYLMGDFNDWNQTSHPMSQSEGVWEISLPDLEGEQQLNHGELIKVVVDSHGQRKNRIPAYIKRAVQDEETYDFAGQVWIKEFDWKHESPSWDKAPIIYECHTGMAQEKEGVGSYREFAENTLPRIKKLGYNCIQLMAVQEHPYYGSFGYHVANFFAASSRFGTPEDLKYLIDKAHGLGIKVIMDIVHSHCVKNEAEGLNGFDGSYRQYFHSGDRGNHPGWDSKLFDYGKTEVLQFLLSNVRFWQEEYKFDGFRYDGVTSMLYFHHGETSFDHYDKYFRTDIEWDAVTYLQLAAQLAHEINPASLLIAEDMSGLPGLCRSHEDGGIGFDYRLGMGIPDYWIKLLKHSQDEEWNIKAIWDTLSNRRYKEKTIAYAESHDQALVGDKTLAFWLMDKEMYFHMRKDDPNHIIDRGISMLKLMRAITAFAGGEGYLNFIGNEFGHPEWIDFPREGNDWSYKYARRQWNLVDNEDLKYHLLNDFDQELMNYLNASNLLSSMPAQPLNFDEENKVVVFERDNVVFVFNFHPERSIPDYKFFVPKPGEYSIVLDSDLERFGGFGRIENTEGYHTLSEDGVDKLSVYCVNRSFQVYKKLD